MRYYFVEPEVAGELGSGTILDTTLHPPVVKKLEYEFHGWSGDVLLESFPCFIVTAEVAAELERSEMTGIAFSQVTVTQSDEFDELYPEIVLPDFRWLKIQGTDGLDDFGLSSDFRLVISERALEILKRAQLVSADLSDFV